MISTNQSTAPRTRTNERRGLCLGGSAWSRRSLYQSQESRAQARSVRAVGALGPHRNIPAATLLPAVTVRSKVGLRYQLGTLGNNGKEKQKSSLLLETKTTNNRLFASCRMLSCLRTGDYDYLPADDLILYSCRRADQIFCCYLA